MKVLKISNKGLLDVNELILMGCSSKTGQNTIGKFGTGLKYAIAVLTRNEIDFSIYLGKNKVNIQKEPVQIRDKEFEQIVINFNKTSITTNLGVEWEVWQGVREFIANSKDEGGGFEIIDDSNLTLHEGTTTIIFDYDQIEDCLSHFDFEDWEEVGDGLFFKRLSSPRRAKVFKEGFLVYEASDNSSFDYRIDSLKINEARVAEDRWEVQRGIANIQALMEKSDVELIVENKETKLGIFYNDDTLSDGWKEISHKAVTGGYALTDAIKKQQAEDKGHDEIKLYLRGETYVSEDEEIEDGIFFQDTVSDRDELWDLDLRTDKIYIWRGEFNREGQDEIEAIAEAEKVRDINIYCKENNLKTPIDTILHFQKVGLEQLAEIIK